MKINLHPTIFSAAIPKRLLVFFCGLMLVLPTVSLAQWSNNTAVNTAMCTSTDYQKNAQIISDGSGGAIVVWQDFRSTTSDDIYIQKINSTGTVQWTANGEAICTQSTYEYDPQLISDGSGGAIIVWWDQRAGGVDDNIYAQRINSAGAVQWTADGVVICSATDTQEHPQIASDGSGGAIISWEDKRGGAAFDIYAQRINSSGTVQWTADGVVISAATNNQQTSQLVSDGSSGAIITWEDFRGGATFDVYSQRVNSSGTVQWTADGVVICTAANNQRNPDIVSDGSGGAIIAWPDLRGGATLDIYAQRINSSGTVQWTANGVAICTSADEQDFPQIVSDGSGGAVISWQDFRSGTNDDVYAQRINVSGTVQWTANGEVISTATSAQRNPVIESDASGGAIIAWRDFRSGTSYDIYAQSINSSGTVQWTADGVTVGTAANGQTECRIATSSGCATIIVFQDARSGTDDIYAHGLNCGGAPLPVEWLYFNALAENNSTVRCEWATGSEINNDYFAIERSKQGITFEQIGTMQGAGNSSNTLHYVYYDDHPYSGVSYYRLRQVDYDGQYEYSPIRAVYIGELEIISIYPNPSSEYIEYTIASETGGPVSLKLIDALGREVLSTTEIIQGGVTSKKLCISTLCSGAYILQITTNAEQKVKKQFLVK